MNAKRTAAAVATLAGLAVGLAACSPDGTPAEPGTPVPTVTETTVASEPAATVTEPAIDDPDTTEPTETESSEPADTAAPPSDGDKPAMDPAEGDLPGAVACYDDNGENRTLDAAVRAEEGAVRAWLCGDAPGGYGTVGPMEPLVGDIDAILADLAALPERTDDPPQEQAGLYRVVFEYEDGSFSIVEGDDQPEGSVWIGEEERVGGEQFLNQVRGRWLDQRLAVGPPDEDAAPHATACPAPDHYIVAHPIEDVSGGWICAGNSEELTALPMDPELAELIAGELRANSTPSEANLPATGTSLSLMVPWGEATVLKMLDNEPGFLWISDQGGMKYEPSPEVGDAIGKAIRNE